MCCMCRRTVHRRCADFPGIDDKKWKCFVNSKYDPKTGETKVFKRTYYKLIPDAE